MYQLEESISVLKIFTCLGDPGIPKNYTCNGSLYGTCMEYEWLNSLQIISKTELEKAVVLVQQSQIVYLNNEFVYWLKKSGRPGIELPSILTPYELLAEGKPKLAAKMPGAHLNVHWPRQSPMKMTKEKTK